MRNFDGSFLPLPRSGISLLGAVLHPDLRHFPNENRDSRSFVDALQVLCFQLGVRKVGWILVTSFFGIVICEIISNNVYALLLAHIVVEFLVRLDPLIPNNVLYIA